MISQPSQTLTIHHEKVGNEDRFHVDVPALSFEVLADDRPSGPSSLDVRGQVQEARNRQRARYNGTFGCNAYLDRKAIRHYCALRESGKALLEHAISKMGFSARAYDKVLRVARTLADLEGSRTSRTTTSPRPCSTGRWTGSFSGRGVGTS